MANHKSAKKRSRQSERRAERNKAIKSRVNHVIREFHNSLTGDAPTTAKALKAATREIQRAGSSGVYHDRTVSRRV